MPNQTLNTVQKNLVNETVRPALERIVAMRYDLDAIVTELANQQTPIAATADILNDSPDGDIPRDDAPNLTGANIAQLQTFATNMRDQIDGVALAALVSLMVRNVSQVIKTPISG